MQTIEKFPEHVEDTIFEEIVPNTLVILARIREVLKEIGTNGLCSEVAKKDLRIRKLMWILNTQMYGMTFVNSTREFEEIIALDTTEFSKKLK